MKHLIARTTIISFLFTSCITSVHRLVTSDKAVSLEDIKGTWVYDGISIKAEQLLNSELLREIKKIAGKDDDPLKGISKEDSLINLKSYAFSYSKYGTRHYMAGSLIKLNGELYMDLLPVLAINSKTDDLLSADVKESYTYAKVNFLNKTTLQLKFLDPGFIESQLKQQRIAIKYEKDDLFDTFVITASTKELQLFLEKYGKDERLYSKETTITLNKAN